LGKIDSWVTKEEASISKIAIDSEWKVALRGDSAFYAFMRQLFSEAIFRQLVFHHLPP